MTGRAIECPLDKMNWPRGRKDARLRVPPTEAGDRQLFTGWACNPTTCRKFAPVARNYAAARLMADVGLRVNEVRSLDLKVGSGSVRQAARAMRQEVAGFRPARADGAADQRRRPDAALARTPPRESHKRSAM
ncbi:hypothetical protein Ahu01nite_079780 [Winogradskya humida]|uniref:Phage integrase family protein n=1 Tax=Winogradskya humida TaxID=113566 RepID=A0ABQ4A1Z1_9ACTN|nr:hypothetical protein Ahu01nite_079780 [Actinoplanes humidus]